MIAGSTQLYLAQLPSINVEDVSNIIFSFKGKIKINKIYPVDVTYSEDVQIFSIPLTQQDTLDLSDPFKDQTEITVEAQINFSNGAVSKTILDQKLYVDKTIATKLMSGNNPSGSNLITFKIVDNVIVATTEANEEQVGTLVEAYLEENPPVDTSVDGKIETAVSEVEASTDSKLDPINDVLQISVSESTNKFDKDSDEVISGYTFFTDTASNRYDAMNPPTGQTIYTASSSFKVTNKIVCKANDVVRFSSGWTRARFFDADGKANAEVFSTGSTEVKQLTAPAGTAYVRVAFNSSILNTFMVTINEAMPSSYVPYAKESSSRFDQIEKPLLGKKWTACGDSLTASSTLASQTESKNYTDFVSESLGLKLTNKAVGGSGYIAGGSNSIPAQCNSIPLDSEIVTVFGSFNDYTTIASNLGQLGDTDSTVYGRIHVALTKIYERCPNAVVGIITPTKWGYLSEWTDPSASAKCDLYVQALIDTCKKWSIPCLDLYHESGLRPWDSTFCATYYKDDDADGTANTVHPLTNAHKKFIAPKVEDFIKKLCVEY